MNSKSFKFMCVSVGVLALSKFTLDLYNVVATIYINSLPQQEVEEKIVGFRGE